MTAGAMILQAPIPTNDTTAGSLNAVDQLKGIYFWQQKEMDNDEAEFYETLM